MKDEHKTLVWRAEWEARVSGVFSREAHPGHEGKPWQYEIVHGDKDNAVAWVFRAAPGGYWKWNAREETVCHDTGETDVVAALRKVMDEIHPEAVLQ